MTARFRCYASGSSGNMYRFGDIIFEAGVKPPVSALKGANICLISHSHSDHCKHYKDMINWGIRVHAPFVHTDPNDLNDYVFEGSGNMIVTDNWKIRAFVVAHDVLNYGYLGQSLRCKTKWLYVTDTGYILPTPKNLTHLFIECNHSYIDMNSRVKIGSLNEGHFVRVTQNHLSVEDVEEYVCRLDRSDLQEIHLLHLSARHAQPDEFTRRIQSASGIPTYIAGGELRNRRS